MEKDKAQLEKVLEAVADGTRKTHEKLEPLVSRIEILDAWRQTFLTQQEKTDARLKEGNGTFEKIKDDVQKLKEQSNLRLADLVDKTSFENYCKEHAVQHENLNRSLQGIRDAQGDLKVSFAALSAEIKASVTTVGGLLAKVVTVGQKE
jgi:chromosome segregation ATPase